MLCSRPPVGSAHRPCGSASLRGCQVAPARGRPRARVPSPWGHSCCWRRKREIQGSLPSCRHPEGGREACACARLCSGVLQSTIPIFCSSQPGFLRLALPPLLPALRPARCHPSARSRAICELAKNKQTNTNLALQTFAARKPSGLISATFGARLGASLLQKGRAALPNAHGKPNPAHRQPGAAGSCVAGPGEPQQRDANEKHGAKRAPGCGRSQRGVKAAGDSGSCACSSAWPGRLRAEKGVN